MRVARLSLVAGLAVFAPMFWVAPPPVPVTTLLPYAETYAAVLIDAISGREIAGPLDAPTLARAVDARSVPGGLPVVAVREVIRDDARAGGTWLTPTLTVTIDEYITYRTVDGLVPSAGEVPTTFVFERSGGRLVLVRVFESYFPGVARGYP